MILFFSFTIADVRGEGKWSSWSGRDGRVHRDPPGARTWQGDVETVHRLQEDEFFDRETFSNPADFWNKTTLYWHHFNLTRRNRAKEWQTPAQIVHTKNPHLKPRRPLHATA